MFFNPPEYIQHGEINRLKAELAEVEMHYADCMDEERMLRTQLAEAQATITRLRLALEDAKGFISNGIEYGYILMPEKSTPDSAHNTLPNIQAALALPTSDQALFEFGLKVAKKATDYAVDRRVIPNEAIVKEVIEGK